MVLDCAAGDCGTFCVCLGRRRSGDASVELAAAAPIRLADARFLASVGIAGVVPDSVRRSGRPRTSPQPGMALPGSLPEDDAGGAGEVSPGNGGRLQRRFVRY